jgi:hypothetical protein
MKIRVLFLKIGIFLLKIRIMCLIKENLLNNVKFLEYKSLIMLKLIEYNGDEYV